MSTIGIFDSSMLPSFKQPFFNTDDPICIKEKLHELLAKHQEAIEKILTQTHFTWSNLMEPLENMHDTLASLWSPISHLQAVKETKALRDAYNDALPLLTAYHTALSQNHALYEAIASLTENEEFKQLNLAQRKIIENEIRDFKLAGVHLPEEKKQLWADLQQRLSKLCTHFSENVLDATAHWFLHIEDENQLSGVPEETKKLYREEAESRQLTGYVISLQFPSYMGAMKYLHDRSIREKLYEAFSTRASDQGPDAGKWDNGNIMEEIISTRQKLAKLVGFKTYADYSLATKMAKNQEEVIDFLMQLLDKSLPLAKKELEAVKSLAKTEGITDIQSWDLAYYSEKLLEKNFQITQETLRPYFPVDQVLSGLFIIVNRLYGITIVENPHIETWHPDVRFYSILDHNELMAGFYVDLFARKNKRDGAWMDECRARYFLDSGKLQLPVAYLTCNFMPKVGDKPALLTHDDVMTLFHEFGHCLHHLLTTVDYPAVGGINGVAWDAVEFPSQFMENFCWEKSVISLITKHYQTGESLPDALFDKMLAAKHFQVGLQMVRQIEFALFDFRLHSETHVERPHFIQPILDKVRHKTALLSPPNYNRFQNSFSHIFAGGYAAGYYSYKWAEVLSADAYECFLEKGIFNPETGCAFRNNILAVGGVRDPMDSFVAFRGRKPTIDALLKQSGIY